MNQATEWDFFIAHAGPDKARAEALYELLVARSRVFLDTKCLQLGDDWDTRIAEAQRASAITLVMVSEGTDAAYYQRDEIAAAVKLARHNAEAHRVVPIFLSPEESLRTPIPYGLLLKHGIRISEHVGLGDTARLLLELLESIQNRELSAFVFGNYLSQLTSPNLSNDDRQALVGAMKALPGLPESWRASITGYVPVTDVFDLIERIVRDSKSMEGKALLLGLHLRSFENILRRRDTGIMPKVADQLQIALRDIEPPPHLADQILARIDATLSDGTSNGVEDVLMPLIVPWLRARGRHGPNLTGQ